MSNNLLDDFSDEKHVKATSKPITDAWKDEEEEEDNIEAICVVCDALFTPIANRPPILCGKCKRALKSITDKWVDV